MKLHAEARTTPKLRAEIQASALSQKALADRYNVCRHTIRKWQTRDDVQDRSHVPHTLQTTLTEAQEWIVVELRTTLLLSLDDLTHITQVYINPAASRSGIDRCFRRHGISNLSAMKRALYGEDPPPKKTFKDYDPGYIHIDIKYLPKMPDETAHQYLYVAIDRASRSVCLAIYPDKTAESTADFLTKVEARYPIKVAYVLTDNGKEFTDRFTAQGEREPTGNHLFDKVCEAIGAEHRLTRPYTPKTNGMVERFNGRISELLQTTHFHSANELAEAIFEVTDYKPIFWWAGIAGERLAVMGYDIDLLHDELSDISLSTQKITSDLAGISYGKIDDFLDIGIFRKKARKRLKNKYLFPMN